MILWENTPFWRPVFNVWLEACLYWNPLNTRFPQQYYKYMEDFMYVYSTPDNTKEVGHPVHLHSKSSRSSERILIWCSSGRKAEIFELSRVTAD